MGIQAFRVALKTVGLAGVLKIRIVCGRRPNTGTHSLPTTNLAKTNQTPQLVEVFTRFTKSL